MIGSLICRDHLLEREDREESAVLRTVKKIPFSVPLFLALSLTFSYARMQLSFERTISEVNCRPRLVPSCFKRLVLSFNYFTNVATSQPRAKDINFALHPPYSYPNHHSWHYLPISTTSNIPSPIKKRKRCFDKSSPYSQSSTSSKCFLQQA